MLDLLRLKTSIKRAISELVELKKVRAIFYEYEHPTLSFNLIVSEKLNDDEIEEARVAQTEVLSDFPDGVMEIFIINQYLISNDDDAVPEVKGNLIYSIDEIMEKENQGKIKGYKLIDAEKAEAEK